jgi:hypothetical protein
LQGQRKLSKRQADENGNVELVQIIRIMKFSRDRGDDVDTDGNHSHVRGIKLESAPCQP